VTIFPWIDIAICKYPITKCKMQNAKCKMQNAKCKSEPTIVAKCKDRRRKEDVSQEMRMDDSVLTWTEENRAEAREIFCYFPRHSPTVEYLLKVARYAPRYSSSISLLQIHSVQYSHLWLQDTTPKATGFDPSPKNDVLSRYRRGEDSLLKARSSYSSIETDYRSYSATFLSSHVEIFSRRFWLHCALCASVSRAASPLHIDPQCGSRSYRPRKTGRDRRGFNEVAFDWLIGMAVARTQITLRGFLLYPELLPFPEWPFDGNPGPIAGRRISLCICF
jgi:hypothetical protein